MGKPSADDRYDEKEAQRRFEAALRGARIAGHKPMIELTGEKRDRAEARPRSSRKKRQ